MRNKIRLLWSNEYIQGGFFLTISSFIINFLNYLFHFIAGRILGPSGYGEITSLYSYISLISVPVAVVSTFFIQKISSRENNQHEYAAVLETLFWKFLRHWLWILFPLLLLIPFIPRITNLTPSIAYTLIPFIILGFIGSFYGSVFQGLRLFFLSALLAILSGVFKLTSIVPAVIKINNISGVVITQLFFSLITLGISIFIIRKILKKFRQKNSLQKNVNIGRILTNKFFLMTLISLLGVALIGALDMIFVKKFFSAYESGIYNSWNLFAKIILYILGPMSQVSFVFFSDRSQRHLQERVLIISIILLGVVGISGYIGYLTFGSLLLNIMFGSKFNAVLPYMGYAAIFGAFFSAITFFNSYFLAKKSKMALLVFFMIPIYIIGLYIIPKNILNIMYVNIAFSALLTIIYSYIFFFNKKSIPHAGI